jgi:GAF domain-containing protein/HAMP domain-containing protein
MSEQPSSKSHRAPRRQASLGTTLTLTLIPLVLIPLVAMAVGAYLRSRTILRDQASAQLSSAAQAEAQALSDWAQARQERLLLGSERSQLKDAAASLVSTGTQTEARQTALAQMRQELSDLRVQESETLFTEVFLARLSDGVILASTTPEYEGARFPALTDGKITGRSAVTVPLYDDQVVDRGDIALLTVVPLRALDTPVADSALIGVNKGLRLGSLMEEMQVFWEQHGVYRVTRGNTFVAVPPDIVVGLESYSMMPVLQTEVQHPVFGLASTAPSGSLEYTSYDGTPVVGAYEWLPDMNLGVVLEVPQSDVFAELSTLGPFFGGLLLATVVLVLVFVPLATRRSIRPLVQLTQLSERMATGDLTERVPVRRQDEIGRLASAFNTMADELAEFYASLEARVKQRTQQMRTAAEVARDATAIRDVQLLLDEAVRIISQRFGYYHAGVFLVDQAGEFAVLRAASSEGGRRMQERGHKLAVGKVGLVGYVTSTGRPRIALDVGKDAVHFANPDLPETRSEMTLPLRVGERVIGALDVQSTLANAFDEADVVVIQTMADQLAVAIENARLLEDQSRVATERRRVIDLFQRISSTRTYDRLLSNVTKDIQANLGYARVTLGLVEGDAVVVRSSSAAEGVRAAPLGISSPIGQGPLGRAVSAMSTVQSEETLAWEPGLEDPTAAPLTVISLPLLSRDQPIGALAVEGPAGQGTGTVELESLELISGQAAVALENRRLLEEARTSLEQVDALYRRQTAEAWKLLTARLEGDNSSSVATYSRGGASAVPSPSDYALRAPIELRGEIIGDLEVRSPRSSEWLDDQDEIVAAVASEVATALEQTRLMEEINRRAAQLQAAAEIARVATGLLDAETLLGRAVRLIQERFGMYHVGVFLLDETGQTAVLQEAAGEKAEEIKERGLRVQVGSASTIGLVTSHGVLYAIPNIHEDPVYVADPLLPDTLSELCLPLKIGDTVIGALDVHHVTRQAFTNDDIAVLETLADQLAVAVQNARLFDEVVRRSRRDEAVIEITSNIRRSGRLDEMLQTAVSEMRKALGARRGMIQLKPSTGDRHQGEGGNGKDGGDLGGASAKASSPGETSAKAEKPA